MKQIKIDMIRSKIYSDGTMTDHTELARVGFTDDDYEIYVNTDDTGKIPHFHYIKAHEWNAFHTSIRIDKAKYFHHGTKQDILNSKQKKELVNFLQAESKNKRFKTNWEYLVSIWNDNNSDTVIDENIEIPDYDPL